MNADEENFVNLHDFLMTKVNNKLVHINENLKNELSGSVELYISDIDNSYYLVSTNGKLEITNQKVETVDCKISITEEYLAQIVGGTLNPQIAMLNEKITVSGQPKLAIYFFNIVCTD